MNLAQRYHREWVPTNLNGCVLYLPFWRYGANQSKIWDVSGQQNHGTITGAVPYPGNPQMTGVGSTFNRGDFTATNAFFWSSLDVSAYAGTDAGSTPFYIEVLDAAGKKATGYLGAVGAGETLGSEKLLTPDFSSDTNWSKEAGWSIAGDVGVGTATGGAIYQSAASIIASGLHKAGIDLVSRTAGTVRVITWGQTVIANQSVPGTYNSYFTRPSTGDDQFYIAGTSFSGTVDNASLKRVTEPPSTAVHIVSSLNGTTRNWASIESGFNPNTIASWNINSVVPRTAIGWFLDDVDDRVAHPSINFGKTHTLLYWIRSFANAKDIIHGGAANNHVAINGTNVYYNAGATELSQAHGGGVANPTMIGVVRSGTTVQFFKNGVQVGADQTLDANNDLTLTTLGSYDTPGTFLGGTLMENGGFTRALSTQEIRSYYDLTRGRYSV